MKPLYFDYNATTPILPRVYQAMVPYLTERFGNPSSDHLWGLTAKRAMDKARAQVAGLIGARPEEIYFTSCATESNSLVLWGVLGQAPDAHLVTTAVEHPAILQNALALERRGVKVTRVPVDEQGLASPQALRQACTPQTRLISVMLANNETGAIQPVAEISAWARSQGILTHTDAAQAVGKIPVDVQSLGVDFLTVAGHKLYAPKGVGALYIRKGVELAPLWHGGGQEKNLRPGTENVPYMAGLGEACALAQADLVREMERQKTLGGLFLEGLENCPVAWRLHARTAPRLPNTMSVGFKGLRAADILSGLVGLEVGASAGAACHGADVTVSHVLTAMRVPSEFAEGTLRFSWGRPTTPEDVADMLERLYRVLRSLV